MKEGGRAAGIAAVPAGRITMPMCGYNYTEALALNTSKTLSLCLASVDNSMLRLMARVCLRQVWPQNSAGTHSVMPCAFAVLAAL